jgi:threonine dehydrogenase-like Zn-dependent dehydrogenase
VTYIEARRVETWDVEWPQLGSADEAILRPIAVATCDLDKALVRGATPWEGPFPLGHEGVAEVLEVGDAVASVRPGDRVCLPYQVSCGRCRRCRAGLTSHCEGHGGMTPGSQYYGFSPTGREWGGFLSDAVRVPFADHMLVPVPFGIAPEVLASLSDNIVDGWRTVAEPLAAQPAAPVLVVGGSGAIGLYAVASAVALGANSVTYVDRRAARLEKAEQLGAEVVAVNAGDWPRSLGAFPITVDASGAEGGLLLALRSTDSGGICTSTGWYFRPVELPLFEFTLKSITFRTGLIQARMGMPHALQLIESGRLDAAVVTDRVLAWDDAVAALPDLTEKLVFSRSSNATA